jgi:REP element-mobilizing transposase RayT
MTLPQRTRLFHIPPPWIKDGSLYFLTICCAQRGHNSLAKPDVFSVITSATRNYASVQKWWAHLLLVMPDHLHAIISFGLQKPMDKLVCDWKRYVAKTAHIRWQDGFFEHRLRNNESLEEKLSYICMNPARANLCSSPDAWPYCWWPSDEPSAR